MCWPIFFNFFLKRLTIADGESRCQTSTVCDLTRLTLVCELTRYRSSLSFFFLFFSEANNKIDRREPHCDSSFLCKAQTKLPFDLATARPSANTIHCNLKWRVERSLPPSAIFLIFTPNRPWKSEDYLYKLFFIEMSKNDSKKVKEHRQLRGVLGRWRAAPIDRTTFHACRRCRKTAVFAVFSCLWVSFGSFSHLQFSAFWSNDLASSVFIFATILLRFFLIFFVCARAKIRCYWFFNFDLWRKLCFVKADRVG